MRSKYCQASLFLLLSGAAPSCATEDESADPAFELLMPSGSGEDAAQDILGSSLTFDTAIADQLRHLRDEPADDRFALIDTLSEPLRGSDDGRPFVSAVEHELEKQMAPIEEPRWAGKVIAPLAVFEQVALDPHNPVSDGRLAGLLDNSLDVFWMLKGHFASVDTDELEDAAIAYHFAAAFSVIASVRVATLATAGYPQSTIEHVYSDAVEANTKLVSGDGRGLLERYVAKHDRRSVSAREKYDADPVLYFVRRSLAEQQHVLE